MFQNQLKLSLIFVSFLLLFSFATTHVSAQSVPGQPDKIPQPGELGSPFSVDHFWKHIAFEFGSGYIPVEQKGAGLLGNGYIATVGVIDRLTPHWNLMAEMHILGLSGVSNPNYSTPTFAFDLSMAYDILPHSRTSPYLIGGAGDYQLRLCNGPGGACNTIVASAPGYNGGIGLRHRLYAGKRAELFTEGRYHYIASGSTPFGQISMLPISAGIRW
jgi:hypothetical protein